MCEKSCENLNLVSSVTKCHAMVALITDDDKFAMIPDRTCPNPTENLGVSISSPISDWLPNCAPIKFSFS